MFARDFRVWARENLRGHWGAAVAVGVVASLLGGGWNTTFEFSDSNTVVDGFNLSDFLSRDVIAVLLTISAVMALLTFVVGGVVQFGQCAFHLNLINRRKARFSDLFSQFYRIWDGIRMQVVIGFFVFLWSLLLIIPGVIASYRYAMVPYLMAEFPDLKVMEAMRESKRLMRGNKGRLFCLQLSFFGWALLSALTLGIGTLWLNPYMKSAETAFYMTVTGREGIRQFRPSASGPELS